MHSMAPYRSLGKAIPVVGAAWLRFSRLKSWNSSAWFLSGVKFKQKSFSTADILEGSSTHTRARGPTADSGARVPSGEAPPGARGHAGGPGGRLRFVSSHETGEQTNAVLTYIGRRCCWFCVTDHTASAMFDLVFNRTKRSSVSTPSMGSFARTHSARPAGSPLLSLARAATERTQAGLIRRADR